MAEAKKSAAKKKTVAKKAPAKKAVAAKKPAAKKAVATKTAVVAKPSATKKSVAAVKQNPTYQQIAELAHKYWAERGGHHGSDREDWLRAERDLKVA